MIKTANKKEAFLSIFEPIRSLFTPLSHFLQIIARNTPLYRVLFIRIGRDIMQNTIFMWPRWGSILIQRSFFSIFLSSFFFFFLLKINCIDWSLVLKTAEFHTKKGVIEAIYVDFWLVRGFNHVRGFKHQPIWYYLETHSISTSTEYFVGNCTL